MTARREAVYLANTMTSVVLSAYRIETDRLTIRPWSPTDAPLVKKAQDESRPNLRQWMTWADREPPELDEVVARMRSLRAAFDRGRIRLSNVPFKRLLL